MARILVVEKNGKIEALLKKRFLKDKVSVDGAANVEAFADRFAPDRYDALIWDADVSTLREAEELLRSKLCAHHSPPTLLILISHGEPCDALSAEILAYPHHSLRWPVDDAKLCALVEPVLKKKREGAPERPGSNPDAQFPVEFEGILAVSLPMRTVIRQILEAAASDVPVLITGETGTGKDLVAAAIHKRSVRKAEPYVSVNTGAVAPELIATELFGNEKGAYTGALEARRGLFEQAHGGTIFLDEISTMDERTQVSLLRVLETKTFRRVGGEKSLSVDVRVIAATNENLEEAVRRKQFREDLYYRLDVFHIQLPPLRERPGAINLLTDYFVSSFDGKYNKEVRAVPPETYRCLRHYSWPGNVRELKNVIQRAVLMAQGEQLGPELLPERIREAAGAESETAARPPIHVGMTLEALEREFITMTLAHTGGNKKEAAAVLGISRRALYNKLRKYELG